MPFGIIGRKLGMTQIITEDGRVLPVTIIQAGPCVVVQVKTKERDGYSALQLGFEEVKESRVKKPLRGHFAKASVRPMRILREFRTLTGDYIVGDEICCDVFSEGEIVDICGITKGRGFAGGMKRHNWRGGGGSHGSMFHRAPGSIGASASPSKVIKGHSMPGHYGVERKTVQNLLIVKVLKEKDILLVRGAVPGPNRGIILVFKNRNKKYDIPEKILREKEDVKVVDDIQKEKEGEIE
ncbi:MAG: 50S ribosomal protein L3 [bacterium]